MEYPEEVFLRSLIAEMVSDPSKIVINRKVDELGVLLTVNVDKPDMGRIIGLSGSTAKAIRTIVRVVGMKYGKRVNVKISEPEPHPYQKRDLGEYFASEFNSNY